MSESHFNRHNRRSGGMRPARFELPELTRADLDILRQEALVRREFGDEGVRLFWERINAQSDKPAALAGLTINKGT
jgi:hypothetical protein